MEEHSEIMTIEEISIENISINPNQPRRIFSEEDLAELSRSILEIGLIHPPLVRPLPDQAGFYELVSGERRFRAAGLAGLKKIPVVIGSRSKSLSAQQALAENIQRVDLNPIEIAYALKSLIDKFGLTQEELAQRMGKKRSTIANYLRVLTLPKNIQESINSGKITMGHAKTILSLSDPALRIWLYERILRDDLSVRQAEAEAQKIQKKAKKKNLTYANRDFYLEQLSDKIQVRMGTKVHIVGKGKKGRILIDYYNLEDLDRLLEIFGVDGL